MHDPSTAPLETKEAEGIRELLAIAEAFGAARRLQETTVGKLAADDARFFTRLRNGEASWTARKYDSVVRWFSANWPEGAAWPESVPRPPAEAPVGAGAA